MAEPDRLEADKAKINEAATNLQGCSILDLLDGKSLQDQIALVRQVSTNNGVSGDIDTTHRKATSNSVKLRVTKDNTFLDDTLFTEYFDPVSGEISYNCTDISNSGSTSRSKQVKF